MSKNTHIIEDIARVAGGAMNILGGVQKHVRDDIKTRVEDIATDIELVPREEHERLETLVSSLFEENKTLKERLDALEKTVKVKKKK